MVGGMVAAFLLSACGRKPETLARAWTLDLATGRLERGEATLPATRRTNILQLPDRSLAACDTEGRSLGRLVPGPGGRLAASSFRLVASYRDYGRRVELRRWDDAAPFLALVSDAYPFVSRDNRLLLLVTGEAEGFTLMDLVTLRTAGPFAPGELITDMAAGTGRFALGLLDGRLVLIGPEVFLGKEPAVAVHERCRVPVVKRVVFSPDGRRVACRHGYGPERITVRTVPGLRKVRDIATGTEVRTRMALAFSPSGRRIVAESPGGFRVYSVLSGRTLFRYEPEGWKRKRFLNAVWMDDQRLAVAVRTAGAAFVGLFGPDGRLLWSEELDEEWVRLVDADTDFLLGYSPRRVFLWGWREKGR